MLFNGYWRSSFLYALYVATTAYYKNFKNSDFIEVLGNAALRLGFCWLMGHFVKRTKKDLTARGTDKKFWMIFFSFPIFYALLIPTFAGAGLLILLLPLCFFLLFAEFYLVGMALQLLHGGRELELKGDDPLMGALTLYSAYGSGFVGLIHLTLFAGEDLVTRNPPDVLRSWRPILPSTYSRTPTMEPTSPETPMVEPSSPQTPSMEPTSPQMPTNQPTSFGMPKLLPTIPQKPPIPP